jgi:HlyD family secretion protein
LKKLALALLVVAAAVAGMAIYRRNTGPKITFVRVKRITLVSTLPTNGKVEPVEWQSIRAERSGIISSVAVREGQPVRKDEVIASISDPSLQAEIQGTEARVSEARANLSALESGGKPAELAEIENSLKQARLELDQLRKDYASLERLEAKQAATRVEAAQARLQDAQAALSLARERAAQSVVRAPISGVIYNLSARAGVYANPGDLLANVGQLDRLRVRLYVDEPELGRIAERQPVTLTWEALSGREWKGTVERLPSSIQALGTRQVGEVICLIANPGHELLPGTNVDATIRTAVVENALVIPKETLRRDAQGLFVFRLDGGSVEHRPVKTGASSISAVQVTEGLAEGDAVALPSDTSFKPGDRLTPVIASGGLG